MITYEEKVIDFVNDLIYKYSSLRTVGKVYNIDPAILSKIKNGKYIPKIKTLLKWFPEIDVKEFETALQKTIVNKIVVNINCRELKELEKQLSDIGYAIEYRIYKVKGS